MFQTYLLKLGSLHHVTFPSPAFTEITLPLIPFPVCLVADARTFLTIMTIKSYLPTAHCQTPPLVRTSIIIRFSFFLSSLLKRRPESCISSGPPQKSVTDGLPWPSFSIVLSVTDPLKCFPSLQQVPHRETSTSPPCA